jgi:hypothetical protein
MGRNLLQRNQFDERETLYHLILRSLRSLVEPPPRARNVKFMLNLSAHVDFSLGIPSLLQATLEMASERALEALNAVDDFVKSRVSVSFVLLVLPSKYTEEGAYFLSGNASWTYRMINRLLPARPTNNRQD